MIRSDSQFPVACLRLALPTYLSFRSLIQLSMAHSSTLKCVQRIAHTMTEVTWGKSFLLLPLSLYSCAPSIVEVNFISLHLSLSLSQV